MHVSIRLSMCLPPSPCECMHVSSRISMCLPPSLRQYAVGACRASLAARDSLAKALLIPYGEELCDDGLLLLLLQAAHRHSQLAHNLQPDLTSITVDWCLRLCAASGPVARASTAVGGSVSGSSCAPPLVLWLERALQRGAQAQAVRRH
jgi:hypothetical protein